MAPDPLQVSEDDFQIWAVEFIRRAVPRDAIVHHSPNEVPGEVGPGWTRKQIKKGMLPGFFDILILYFGKTYLIELKVKNRRLTVAQRQFRAQLERHGFPHAECWSQEQVVAALVDWGLTSARLC